MLPFFFFLLFIFYIQGVLNLKENSGPKGLSRSFGFLVINVCNHEEHYETLCIYIYIYIYIYIELFYAS
jgi:hypothetical protein